MIIVLLKMKKKTLVGSLPLCVHQDIGVGTLGHGLGLGHGLMLVDFHCDFFDENI